MANIERGWRLGKVRRPVESSHCGLNGLERLFCLDGVRALLGKVRSPSIVELDVLANPEQGDVGLYPVPH